jgi:hypothetical protein
MRLYTRTGCVVLVGLLVLLMGAGTRGDTRSVRMGLNIPNDGSVPPHTLQTLGVEFVRLEFADHNKSNPLEVNFRPYDHYIDALQSAGIRVLLLVDYETWLGKPAYNAPTSVWAQYISEFAARLGVIAQHYKNKIHAYEIWNEEDFPPGNPSYDPSIPPQIYSRLLKASYKAIKKEDTKVPVVVGGLESGSLAYAQTIITSAAGVLWADGVAVHPYGRRPFQDWPNSQWGFGPLNPFMASLETAMQSVLTHKNRSVPLYITEYGVDESNPEPQFPFRFYSAVNESNSGLDPSHNNYPCPVAFWFCWSDSMVPPFGLVQSNGTPKPIYYSYQKFAQLPYRPLHHQ